MTSFPSLPRGSFLVDFPFFSPKFTCHFVPFYSFSLFLNTHPFFVGPTRSAVCSGPASLLRFSGGMWACGLRAVAPALTAGQAGSEPPACLCAHVDGLTCAGAAENGSVKERVMRFLSRRQFVHKSSLKRWSPLRPPAWDVGAWRGAEPLVRVALLISCF